MANSGSILRQAYTVPLTRLGDAARVFWPVAVSALMSEAWIGYDSFLSASPLGGGIFIFMAVVIAITVVGLALGAAAAVRWHRLLVLDEAPQPPSLFLDGRDRTYWKRAFLLGLPRSVVYCSWSCHPERRCCSRLQQSKTASWRCLPESVCRGRVVYGVGHCFGPWHR
jgi:hypothetical protein